MTDFEEGRAAGLADRRARAVLAEADAALVGDDVVLTGLIRDMTAAINSWQQMRAAWAIAGPRFDAGEYDAHDVEDRREHHELALTTVVRLARQIVDRHDLTVEQEATR